MNLLITCIGLMISIIGLIEVINGSQLEKETRKWLLRLFILLIAYIGSALLGCFAEAWTGKMCRLLLQLSIFMESTFSGGLMWMLTGLLLVFAKEKEIVKNKLFIISGVIWFIYMSLLIYTQFSTEIYYIDSQNVYHRGPWYPILLTPPVLLMIWNYIVLAIKRNKLLNKQIFAFSIYLILPTICMILQMLFYGILFIVLGTSISAFYLFICILIEQKEIYYKRESENALLKMDILLAQIQPHFLYNTLTTIKYICRNDPKVAEEAIGKFTMYLRHNMDSITMDRPILFMEELKHVKAYVELQQLRFGEELKIQYDLECTDFKIPTLTLQPLVENAISYGIRKSESGMGTITISTRELMNRIEVIVKDDGPGFDINRIYDSKDRSHMGLKNVKERIRLVVGGKCEIDSKIGEGTTVTIKLPKED
ncbi:MAG: hypothetical protein E7254_12790 [Lachnospiraceae bacterium]|nr:hypothetical protein [Lachnospiraceae bacterium]